jgi:crotonobetainyl-CoA:carnitine CoA-transferase CaiB-like acyl-CoA transferase
MERWGLGYEQTLAKRYPKLVYCAVTGFGADGPLGGLPGYDAVLQALCGLMSINGDEASGATRMGIPIVDHLTGYVALTGILMALNARHRTTLGQRVEATLFDTAISLLLPHASNYFSSQNAPRLLGSAHPNIAPYDKFRARDGDVFLGIVNDVQFRRFCSGVGLEGLADDARFRTNSTRIANRDELKRYIENAIAEESREPLCERLMRAGVPAGAVNTLPQALEHPHCEQRAMVIRKDGYVGLRSPIRLHGTPGSPTEIPPGFAEHSAEILSSLGFSAEEAQRLGTTGAAPARVPSLQ